MAANAPHPPSSSLAKAGEPVFTDASDGTEKPRRTYPPLEGEGRLASRDARRGGVTVSQLGRRSKGETVTPPCRSFHSRRPSHSGGGWKQPSQLPCITKRERRHPPGVLVEDQGSVDRRLGALAAVFAFAKPAVDADRRALDLFQIHSGGVDQARRMADFTTEPDGKTGLCLRVRRHPPPTNLRDRKITRAVWQFDHLFQQPVRRVEGRMHVPQRTSAAEFREWKSARGKSFRDVAGVIDAQQKERHAARVRPLQGSEAVADLLEPGIEALRQHVDVVAELLRGSMKGLIGHHDSSRKVICQRNPVQPAWGVVQRTGAADNGLKTAVAFGDPDLKRKLERASGSVDQFGDQQLPAMAIGPPQGLAHDIDRHDAGDDRMLFAQPRCKRRKQAFGRHVQFVAQILRRLLELEDIIAVGLDQVADALDRIGLEAGAFVAIGELRGRHRLAAARLGIGGVEPLQRMSNPGAQFREIAQFLLWQVDLPEQRIGKDLVQLGKKPILVGGREIAQIEVIGFRQPEQDLRRHRALVALDQVDIARGNPETLGDLGLRQAQLLTDAPESGADKQLLSGVCGHDSLADLFCDKNYKSTTMTSSYVT